MIAASECAVIVLAAGLSRRFGLDNKLLSAFEGRPLLTSVLECVTAIHAGAVIVVTGHDREGVEALASGFSVTCVHNADFAQGMGASIACGVSAVPAGCDAVFVVPGDMPRLQPNDFEAVRLGLASSGDICRPEYRGTPGHPVLFGRAYFEALGQLKDSDGAKAIVDTHKAHLRLVRNVSEGVVFDVDTGAHSVP